MKLYLSILTNASSAYICWCWRSTFVNENQESDFTLDSAWGHNNSLVLMLDDPAVGTTCYSLCNITSGISCYFLVLCLFICINYPIVKVISMPARLLETSVTPYDFYLLFMMEGVLFPSFKGEFIAQFGKYNTVLCG